MDNFDLRKYLAEGKLLKEVQNKLPLEIIQDMYLVAATIDQGYEPAHDMKRAEETEEKYTIDFFLFLNQKIIILYHLRTLPKY